MRFKVRKTGIILACINIVLILAVISLEFFPQAKGNATGGWLFLGPILWNLPVTLLLMPFAFGSLPEWLLVGLVIVLGSMQWYFIGHGAEVLIFWLKNQKKEKKS